MLLKDMPAYVAESVLRLSTLPMTSYKHHLDLSSERQLPSSVVSCSVAQPSRTLNDLHAAIDRIVPGTKYEPSVVSTGKSLSSSALSIASVRRRLKSKYSASILEDIQLLIGRLSISSCSETSSNKILNRPDQSTTTTTSLIKLYGAGRFCTQPMKPLETAPKLPGGLPRYCWEHIIHNRLLTCDNIRFPCNRRPMFKPVGSGCYLLTSPGILSRISTQSVLIDDLNTVDSFRNSVLHMAAALRSHFSYMITLIGLGADVNALNNANQTFLHLVDFSEAGDLPHFRSLLRSLACSSFDFLQQDLNGQTTVQSLTQEHLPWEVFSSTVDAFRGHGVTSGHVGIRKAIRSRVTYGI